MQEEMGLRGMRKLVYVGIILLTVLGCENESAAPICGNLDEGENNWIQEQINDLEEVDDKWSFIIQAEYNCLPYLHQHPNHHLQHCLA